jgi:hypothetical protein
MAARPTLEQSSERAQEPRQPLNSMAPASSLALRAWRSPLPPLLFIIAAAAFTFRYPLFYGYRFLGNSDRWNQYLLFVQLHSDAIERGNFSAWTDNLLGGFDILAQPFSFFTPLNLIPPLLHTNDVVGVFAWVAFVIFATTLGLAYWVIEHFTQDRLASLTGAFIYTCSTYALLKLSQNDTTYLSVLVAPILFYLVHMATRQHRLRTAALIAGIAAICLYTAFLQEFSYVVLFLGGYAVFRALRGNPESLIAITCGVAIAVAIAFPRLLVEYQTLTGTMRVDAGLPHDYGIPALFRFFSRDIFGRSYAEGLLGPQINLYEGDLLFAAVFASLLLVWILADRARHVESPLPSLRQPEVLFLVGYIVFVLATMHVGLVYRAVSLAYANLSFQHSRIGVSAILPVGLLSALYLRRRVRQTFSVWTWAAVVAASGVVIAATVYDYEAWRGPILKFLGQPDQSFIVCTGCIYVLDVGQFLAVDVIRFSLLAVLFVGLMISRRWLAADAVRTILIVGISFQAIWGASVWFSGPDTRDYGIPYEGNNLVLAPPGDFTHPTVGEIHQLKAQLDNDNYRSITICPPEVILVDCSNPIGVEWDLRLLDGYLSGVPRRLASLPWARDQASLHQIRFDSAATLPWRLLSLLNVRAAVVVTPALYTNAGAQLPSDLQIARNPGYVYPRAYFARTIESVSEADDIALTREFFGGCTGCDNTLPGRKPVDEVEGPVAGAFDDSGDISVTGRGDHLEVTFPPSSGQRFLVMDEVYANGWMATSAAGQELTIYPTNVVLRGLVVPAGVGRITFQYHSFLESAAWYTLALAVVAAAAIGVFHFTRQPVRDSAWSG